MKSWFGRNALFYCSSYDLALSDMSLRTDGCIKARISNGIPVEMLTNVSVLLELIFVRLSILTADLYQL